MDGVDIEGMVRDGFLSLDRVFADYRAWQSVEEIAEFTTRCDWSDDPADLVEAIVSLQSVTRYGITVYRWSDEDADGLGDAVFYGPPTFSREKAIADGKQHARECHVGEK